MLGGLTEAVAPVRRWPHGEDFRTARLCYDHLAGRLGVAVHGALVGRGWITPAAGGWLATPVGEAGLGGARRRSAGGPHRPALRLRLHGLVGTARRIWRAACGREIAACCLRRHWLARLPGSGRAIRWPAAGCGSRRRAPAASATRWGSLHEG